MAFEYSPLLRASICLGLAPGRFQYTGQTWFPEVGLYNYKARWYSATMGRFMQTDPIGYKDNVNLYAYVGDDPVDNVDPSGEADTPSPDVIVHDSHRAPGPPPPPPPPPSPEIVVTARRPSTQSDGGGHTLDYILTGLGAYHDTIFHVAFKELHVVEEIAEKYAPLPARIILSSAAAKLEYDKLKSEGFSDKAALAGAAAATGLSVGASTVAGVATAAAVTAGTDGAGALAGARLGLAVGSAVSAADAKYGISESVGLQVARALDGK